MISLKNVSMAYTKNYNILQDINLNVSKGQKVLLLGEEGSGKTSLIRICLGLEKNFQGSCFIGETPVAKTNFEKEISAVYISSKGAFLEGKSCLKNIKYVLAKRSEDGYDSEIKICSALKAFGIFSYKDIKAKKLSSFNRIMLQFARASFRQKIDILCVDDVFANLTEVEKNHVIKHLNSFIAANKPACVIAVSSEKTANEIGGDVVKINLGSIDNGI